MTLSTMHTNNTTIYQQLSSCNYNTDLKNTTEINANSVYVSSKNVHTLMKNMTHNYSLLLVHINGRS